MVYEILDIIVNDNYAIAIIHFKTIEDCKEYYKKYEFFQEDKQND